MVLEAQGCNLTTAERIIKRSENALPIVSNWKVYDLEESIKASGYPMVTDKDKATFSEKRLKTLGGTEGGGHDQFLSGIVVSFDLTLTIKAWTEAERYRFLTFVSSQSTMHRIQNFDIDYSCVPNVDRGIVKIVEGLKAKYNETGSEEDFLNLIYSVPVGFRLTARMTTNYRCLKNLYFQRKAHRIPEWREVCKWIETLPYMKDLIDIKNTRDKRNADNAIIAKKVKGLEEITGKTIDEIIESFEKDGFCRKTE